MRAVKVAQPLQQKGPVSLHIEMRPGWSRQNGIWARNDRDFGQRLAINQHKFRVGLTDVYDRDMACHGM